MVQVSWDPVESMDGVWKIYVLKESKDEKWIDRIRMIFQNVDDFLREAPLGQNSQPLQPLVGLEKRPPQSTPSDQSQSPANVVLVEGFMGNPWISLEQEEVFMHSITNYAHGNVVDINWCNQA